MNVKIVKLLSGDELIGEWDQENSLILNPVVMIPVNSEKIAFQAWMPYVEDTKFQL